MVKFIENRLSNGSVGERCCAFINIFFHPLLVPFYFALVVLFSNNYFNTALLSPLFKVGILIDILVFTTVSPLCLFVLVRSIWPISQKYLSSLSLSALCGLVSYIIATFSLSRYVGMEMSLNFFSAFLLVAIFGLGFSFFANFNLHVVSLSTLVFLVGALSIAGYGDVVYIFSTLLMVLSLVMASKIYLGKTTLLAVSITFFASILVALLGVNIF